jgi:hypothetical protein
MIAVAGIVVAVGVDEGMTAHGYDHEEEEEHPNGIVCAYEGPPMKSDEKGGDIGRVVR